MKNLRLILFVVTMVFVSCSSDDGTTQEEDNAQLNKLYEELVTLSEIENHACTDPNDWSYAKLADVCTGELDIIYYKNINTPVFFEKVALYKRTYENYTKKWGNPNCGAYLIYYGKPKGLDCYNDKPRLYYGFLY